MSAPSTIAHYRISGKLGEGGMGAVYRATDTKLNREVAIKVLPESFAGDPDRLARFTREAHVLASLNHPNIAQIFGVEENAIVMELVEGRTLAERVGAGPVPLEEALAIARQIADALEAAHERGVVHRDLKPANIKVTEEGRVKVLDFGLAKALSGDAAGGEPAGDPVNSPTLTMAATRAGVIMGTAGYMSPEQARGKPVDKRADIWAFGVVLWEMLAGRKTFDGETVSDTLAAVLRADIEWTQLPASTPPRLRRILQRCLERDPKKRLRDIGDVWIDLDTPDQVAAPAAARQRFRAWWLGWAAAAAVGAASLAWTVLHRAPAAPRAVARWTYPQKEFVIFPSLSRDGTRLLFTQGRFGSSRLLLRMMDQPEAKAIPGGENLYFGVFSPDGQWIAAIQGAAEWKLKKIPVTGGTAITLADITDPAGLSWGDDGTIVFSSDKKLMRVANAGGKPEALTTPDTKKGEAAHLSPHFLPGARAVLFTVATTTGSQIAALDVKGGGHRIVAANGLDGRYVPTGHLVYVRGDALFAAPFDAGRLEVTGPEAPVAEGIGVSGAAGGVAEYAFADSGLLIYVEGAGGGRGGTTLAWSDRQGKVQPLSDRQVWGTGRLSPDGRRIANGIFASSAGAAEGDIWVFEVERKTRTRLTFGGANSDPVWTPDGRRITYAVRAGGTTGIFWAAADGSGKPEQLLATDAAPAPSSWSPDGKSLLYSQGQRPRIWVLPVSGGVAGKPFPLHDTAAVEFDGQISPDGRWVAYASLEAGQPEVYVHSFPGPGGKERVSTHGGVQVRWARNGRELLYRPNGGGLMVVEVQTAPQLRVGLPKELVKGPLGTTWDAAPDGKRFLVELVEGTGQGASRNIVGVSDWFEELRRRVPVKR